MKQYNIIICAVLLSLALFSCKKAEIVEDTPFIAESSLVFPVQGGSEGFIILSEDVVGAYTASTKSEWCTLSQNGLTINISVTPNGSISSRYASIEVEYQGEKEYVTVYQYGSICDLGPVEDIELSCLQQSYTYPEKLKSDLPVTVSTSASWAVASISEELEVSVAVEINPDSGDRSCTLLVDSQSGKTKEVTIKQGGVSIVVSKETASINALRGGRDSIVVISPIPYSVRCDYSWCSTEIVEDTLIIIADSTVSDRSGKLYLDYGSNYKEIAVEQSLGYDDFVGSDWKIWSLSPSSSTFSYVNMTIVENVKGSSFIATTEPLEYSGGTSISPVPKYSLAFDMTYDSTTKKVTIAPHIVAYVTVVANNGTYSGQTVENADLWIRATNGSQHTAAATASIIGTWDSSSGTPSIIFEGADYPFTSGEAKVSAFLFYPYYPGSAATASRLRTAYAFRLQTGEGNPIHITKQ